MVQCPTNRPEVGQQSARPGDADSMKMATLRVAKTTILLVIPDESLRETLEVILRDEGYPVVSVTDAALAVQTLHLSPHPLLVILMHGSYDALGSWLLQYVAATPPHAYLLLSTQPLSAPDVWNPHLSERVPVVACPFDLESCLAQIAMLSHELVARYP